MDLIAFYADNALIKKATSAEETPTPGYLYHEIVGITHKSVEACQNLENVLLSRLENESPIVKLKALRTIKHILLKGHVSVKRDLMNRASEIRPCAHVRGPPDQLRGDSMWQSVRTEAQDVLTLIFDTEQRPTAVPVAISSMGSEHMGTSSAAYNNYSHSSSSISNRAPNGTYTPSSSSASNTFAEANANYRSSSSQSNISNSNSTNGSTFGQDIKNKISSLPGKFASPARPNHELSNFGSISAVSHAGAHTHSAAGSGAEWAYNPPTATSINTGDEESTIVDDITNPSGSPTLTFQALDQFCSRCALLDQNRVAEFLFKKLDARAWQSRHKALVAMEALLLSSTGSVIRDTCIDKRTAIEGLLAAMQPATREKAKQVLTLLGVSVDPTTNTTTHALPQASPPTPRISHDTPMEPTSSASLFAGLAITTPAPSASAHPSADHAAQNTYEAPPLINVSETDDDQPSLVEARERNKAANTSLLSFLEASAKIPASPAPMRELAHAAHPDELDDSPLINSSTSSSSYSLQPPTLQPTQQKTEKKEEQLIDMRLSPTPDHPPASPDLLANFRTPLKSSAPISPSSRHSPSNSFLSSSQPISPSHNSDSFLTSLMESSPPSSLEFLETPGVTILSPSPSSSSPSSASSSAKAPPAPISFSLSSPSSSPFAPPPKVPMVANFTAKPSPTTIPHHPHHPQHPHNSSPFALLTSGYPPLPTSTAAPSNIRTTSSTSMYAPLTSVPRAPPQQISPSSSSPSSSLPTSSSSSSSSSFNFVQQKKQDHFGDLVSIQIKQMNPK